MHRYMITPDDKDGFVVQVHYESGITAFHSFKTRAEAKAWISKQDERAENDDPAKRRIWPI
jgi:type I site-specific restriction-modification system R (restriction) subunit